ncbi:hypothetical protein F2P81_004829 [Scophthalmus maximus]|uniref:Transcription initiation factor TFIID component TAF4 C-terminal domain-containing protein n=1 Tax=Scophthalmus maximus TaxID=52904 RepID=A0A6A4TNC4_SCOMX|nr:hypothetical protein F2P81_004829 [Scophthalmus maximus]
MEAVNFISHATQARLRTVVEKVSTIAQHRLDSCKSRSRQEDPEQARLKQKAKEMQQQELAQMRQRDANLTALAAIGPRKKRKVDSPGATPSGTEVSGSTAGSPASSTAPSTSSRQYARQRITRVNLRDLIFYMEQERETAHSLLLYRALLNMHIKMSVGGKLIENLRKCSSLKCNIFPPVHPILICYVFAESFSKDPATDSACFISISNIAHAKYKLSQALLLNYDKSP